MTSDPKRLFDEDPGIAHLVSASEKDAPPSAQMERLLSLASQAAAAPRRPSWQWTRPSIVLGIAAIGVSAFGISVGAGAFRHREPAPAVAPASVEPAQERSAAGGNEDERKHVAVSATATPIEDPVMTVSVADLAFVPASATPTMEPSVRRAAGVVAVTPRASTAPRSDLPTANAGESLAGGSTFDEELALVSAARTALQRGDVPACMRAVEDYRARFGAGTFAQEVEVIRIEGLLGAGERARARSAAQQFLAANAASPYADRVRSLLDRTAQ